MFNQSHTDQTNFQNFKQKEDLNVP